MLFLNHLQDQGNCSPGTLPGDIIIILQVQNQQDGFARSNNDLMYNQKILLSEALTNFSLKIKTLDGRVLYISHSGIIKPGDFKIIPKEGINGANLRINFDIVFPTEPLNKNQKKELTKILPVPSTTITKDAKDIEYKL